MDSRLFRAIRCNSHDSPTMNRNHSTNSHQLKMIIRYIKSYNAKAPPTTTTPPSKPSRATQSPQRRIRLSQAQTTSHHTSGLLVSRYAQHPKKGCTRGIPRLPGCEQEPEYLSASLTPRKVNTSPACSLQDQQTSTPGPVSHLYFGHFQHAQPHMNPKPHGGAQQPSIELCCPLCHNRTLPSHL